MILNEMTLTELEAAGYRTIAIIEHHQRQLHQINQQIATLAQKEEKPAEKAENAPD